MALVSDRVPIVMFFHDDVGNWNVQVTKRFVQDLLWWMRVVGDVYEFIKSCDDFQKMCPLRQYHTIMHSSLKSLLELY